MNQHLFKYRERMGLLLLLAVALLLAACGNSAPATQSDTPPATPQTSGDAPANGDIPEGPLGPAANLEFGCVNDTYDPAIDYFPEKVTIAHATGWSIEYFKNYKVITVLRPWQNADVTFQYVLVQCGTPTPEGFDDAQIIEVPVERIVTMSTTHLPHLVDLGVLDRLVALDNVQYVNTSAVVDLVERGDVAQVGSGAEVNVEKVLALDPDVIMTADIGEPGLDAHPALLEAGLPVALNADFVETTPLGHAEWVKFMAAFFNREAAAEALYGDVTTQYQALTERVSSAGERPAVLANAPWQGTWYVPGGKSYMAQLFSDAGGDYLWSESDVTVTLDLSFETVYDQARDADIWINVPWNNLDEALQADERFGDFAALQQKQVYANNARVNEFGGNDFWESGVTKPHLLLADLIAIFHPDILPEHELHFYRQLE